MAKQTARKTATLTPPNDLKWINRNLSSEEIDDHNAKEKQPSELGVLLFRIVNEGYNLRIAYDDYSKCFQANLIPYHDGNPNYGYAISARGGTPQRAISMLLYKHYAIFRENWSAFYQAPRGGFEG